MTQGYCNYFKFNETCLRYSELFKTFYISPAGILGTRFLCSVCKELPEFKNIKLPDLSEKKVFFIREKNKPDYKEVIKIVSENGPINIEGVAKKAKCRYQEAADVCRLLKKSGELKLKKIGRKNYYLV